MSRWTIILALILAAVTIAIVISADFTVPPPCDPAVDGRC